MTTEIQKWFKAQSITISSDYLRKRLESHPDYPSLIAVQDTLEELGISAYACQGTKQELQQEKKPFLAHFTYGGGDIRFFRTLSEAEQKAKEFDKYWSGHVMFLNKPEIYGNADHDKLHKQEKLNRFYAWLAFVLAIGSIIGLTITQNNIPVLLLEINNTIGLGFGWLIAQKEFGISNTVTDKICSIAKHSRCEAVILSKGAKLFNWLTWGDVGIVYFSASLLFLLYSLLTYQPVNLYYAVSLCGLVFPFYSVYYQWRVVKQWCMLCLGVLTILISSGIISLINIDLRAAPGSHLAQLLIFACTGLFVLAVWLVAKAAIQKMLKSTLYEIQALRTKRSPQILNALLEKQEFVKANLPWENEAIVFGNNSAPYKIVMACNPYCGPCAKAHYVIEKIYEKYPNMVEIAIRFALDNFDDNDIRIKAANSIIQAALNNPFEAVKGWYMSTNLDVYKKIYKTLDASLTVELRKQIAWGKDTGITGTPTFFVNGRVLPELFSWVDFTNILDYELKNTN